MAMSGGFICDVLVVKARGKRRVLFLSRCSGGNPMPELSLCPCSAIWAGMLSDLPTMPKKETRQELTHFST